LNEGGYGRIQEGRRIANQIQASEKIPVLFELRPSPAYDPHLLRPLCRCSARTIMKRVSGSASRAFQL
jgi:hypothetical protein